MHVTEATTTSWLEWLSNEHASDFSRIREQIKQVLKEQQQDVKLWEDLTVEQLSSLSAIIEEAESAGACYLRRRENVYIKLCY